MTTAHDPSGPGTCRLRAHPASFVQNVGAVEAALQDLGRDEATRVVEIDLSDVALLSSRALRSLVELRARLEQRSGTLRLVNVSSELLRLLQLVRLDGHFDLGEPDGGG